MHLVMHSSCFIPEMSHTMKRQTSVCSSYSELSYCQTQTFKLSNSASMTPDGSMCSSPKGSVGSHNTSQSPIYCSSTEGRTTPLKKHVVTVHRVNENRCNMSKVSSEEVLTSLFLEPNSKLLYSYSQALISRSDYNSYHVRILLKFFKSRGKLTHLITKLSDIEVDRTNGNNELFRGNSAFTRVFSEYLKTYCGDFLQSIINPIQEVIADVKMRQSPVLTSSEEPINSALLARMFKQVLERMSVLISDNSSNIPSHLRYILRHIYNSVYLSRGEEDSKHVLETLIFLRFLLPPLAQNPQLLKKLQTLLKFANGKVISKTVDDKNDSLTTKEETLFINSVNLLYRTIINGPLSFGTSLKGVKRSEQDESYHDIVVVIRAELHKISNIFGEGFEAVFDVVKGKKEIVNANIMHAAEGMTEWMTEREREVEEENRELKLSIERLKKSCSMLKVRILELQTNDSCSSF